MLDEHASRPGLPTAALARRNRGWWPDSTEFTSERGRRKCPEDSEPAQTDMTTVRATNPAVAVNPLRMVHDGGGGCPGPGRGVPMPMLVPCPPRSPGLLTPAMISGAASQYPAAAPASPLLPPALAAALRQMEPTVAAPKYVPLALQAVQQIGITCTTRTAPVVDGSQSGSAGLGSVVSDLQPNLQMLPSNSNHLSPGPLLGTASIGTSVISTPTIGTATRPLVARALDPSRVPPVLTYDGATTTHHQAPIRPEPPTDLVLEHQAEQLLEMMGPDTGLDVLTCLAVLRAKEGDFELALEALFEMNNSAATPTPIWDDGSSGIRGGSDSLDNGASAMQGQGYGDYGIDPVSGDGGTQPTAWSEFQDPSVDAEAALELLLCGGGGSVDLTGQARLWEQLQQQQQPQAQQQLQQPIGQLDVTDGEGPPGRVMSPALGGGVGLEADAAGGLEEWNPDMDADASRGDRLEDLRIYFGPDMYDDAEVRI